MLARLLPLLVVAAFAGIATATSAQAPAAAGPQTTLAPVADASVSASAGTARGRVLRVGPGRRDRAFVRFRVPALSGGVASARLRLRASAARRAGIDVLVLPSSARWTERSLRYRNAPRGGRLAGGVERVRRGTFTVSLDVARLRLAAGRKLDLAIVARSCTRSRCPRPLALASREAGARGPRLLLRGTPAPAPTPTPTPAPPADTTPPTVALTAPATGASADASPAFAGTAEAAAGDTPVTVQLARTGSPTQELSAAVAGDGTWRVRAGVVPPGTYSVTASQRDAAGNLGTSSPISLTVVATIAAAGDIACAPNKLPDVSHCQQQATSDLLVGGGYHDVLALGDNQYDVGTLANFMGSYDPTWGRVRAITRPVTGNHEYSATYPPPASATADGYFDYFNGAGVQDGPAGHRGDGWYSFDLGDWHLIALNSNCGQIRKGAAADGCALGSPQETWLQADLAAHPNACTLAYWHYPRFSSGNAADSDHVEMSQFWDDLNAAGADLVLVGHQHGYERFAPMGDSGPAAAAGDGMREFVVGTGGEDFHGFSAPDPGSQVINANTFGVLRLALHASSYDWRFVPIAGSTFTDSGTQACR